MEYVISLLVVTVIITVFCLVVRNMLKKEAADRERWLAEIPPQQLEELKMKDYQNYDADPKLLVADAIVTDVVPDKKNKKKVCLIFYSIVIEDYTSHYAKVEASVCEERQIKKGDFIKVLLAKAENGLYYVKQMI